MNFDLCVTVYRNLDCLRLAARGFVQTMIDPKNLSKVILHVQDPAAEEEQAIKSFSDLGFDPVVASRGPEGLNMSDILDRLAVAATSEWIVFSEQDAFVHVPLDDLVRRLDNAGYDAAGPVDTMHYSHPNARNQQLYGQYGRLSPQPGYFHSSLVLVRRSAIQANSRPFTIPDGFQMHGHGVLGGETYYGLRINLGDDARRFAFFHQVHAPYGYAAEIEWDNHHLATHLYYSGTRRGYGESGFLRQDEVDWIDAEEKRFLRDYEREL